MRTAVAAPAPDPMQEVAQMLANWLAVRVARELISERARQELIVMSRSRLDWWQKYWPKP